MLLIAPQNADRGVRRRRKRLHRSTFQKLAECRNRLSGRIQPAVAGENAVLHARFIPVVRRKLHAGLVKRTPPEQSPRIRRPQQPEYIAELTTQRREIRKGTPKCTDLLDNARFSADIAVKLIFRRRKHHPAKCVRRIAVDVASPHLIRMRSQHIAQFRLVGDQPFVRPGLPLPVVQLERVHPRKNRP